MLSSNENNRQQQLLKKQVPWFNKSVLIGTLAAIQIILPTVAFNPSPSFADNIPLVGTQAPDFTLPSNAGKLGYLC